MSMENSGLSLSCSSAVYVLEITEATVKQMRIKLLGKIHEGGALPLTSGNMLDELYINVEQDNVEYDVNYATGMNKTYDGESKTFSVDFTSWNVQPTVVRIGSNGKLKWKIDQDLSVQATCLPAAKRCNSVVECDNLSDEMGCLISGEYSKMAVKNDLIVLAPNSDNTICFYAFGPPFSVYAGTFTMSPDTYFDKHATKRSAEPLVPSEGYPRNRGYYCGTFVYPTDSTGSAHTFNLYEVFSDKDPIKISSRSLTNAIQYWHLFPSESGPIKNSIVYSTVLTTAAMKDYINKCGESSYPSSTLLYLDHHAIMVMNMLWFPQQNQKYSVLPSVCQNKGVPSTAVDLSKSYICQSGKSVMQHCIEGYCGNTKRTKSECDYKESTILALSAQCRVRTRIINKYNNQLAVRAIESSALFCSSSTCTTKAYIRELKGGTTNTYKGEKNSMKYSNWTTEPISKPHDRLIYVDTDGKWGVDDSSKTGGKSLCELNSSNTYGEVLTFSENDTDKYSQIAMSKDKIIDKLTICFASNGSGVLLHYVGSSSISKKDLFISIGKSKQDSVDVTVYVAGFPEYFNVPLNTGKHTYICIRWEKLTGRIDMAAGGQWIVGRNSYANNRKINLPRNGKMVVGAQINDLLSGIITANKFSGIIYDISIWNSFYNPGILSMTSSNSICTERIKRDNWMTFEDVIAGITNKNMYSKQDHTAKICFEAAIEKKTSTYDDGVFQGSISFNYESYISNPSSIQNWINSSQSGVKVNLPEGYTVREKGGKGNLKLAPLTAMCIQNIDTNKVYDFSVLVHSTGMTALQIGDKYDYFGEGSPTMKTFEDVSAVQGGTICITNILSPSDYAPLDGFIEKISYSVKSTLLCPGEKGTYPNIGSLIWPATTSQGPVSVLCQYGSNTSYDIPGYATRECTATGWSSSVNSLKCASKLTISTNEAKTYFTETSVTSENVEEYTETISQVIIDTEDIDEKELTTAADAMEKVAQSDDVVITENTFSSIVDIADTINRNTDSETMKRQQKATQSATKIVKSVANLAGRVELNEGTQFQQKTKTVSVAAYKPEKASTGSISATFTSLTGEGTDIKIKSGDNTPQPSGTSQIVIPADNYGDENIWFTSYQSDQNVLFESDTFLQLKGNVLGAGIGKKSKDFGDKAVMLTFLEDNLAKSNAYCQYWDMDSLIPGWSDKGMKFVSKDNSRVVCESSHLTNFAILVNPSNSVFSPTETLVLKVITYIGCILSIIGLSVTIVGLAFFKQIRSGITNRVHIGLSASLLMAYLFLLMGAERTETEGVCYTFSIIIHFAYLSAFCWMLCEAVNLYLRLIVVFNYASKVFLKFSIFSSVVPAVIVGITIIIEFAGNNGAYIITNRVSGNRVYCWLQYEARMAAFMLPLLLMLCVNFVVFIMAMRVIFANKKADRSQWLPRLRSAVAVSTLIGLSWIVGVLALGQASFAINIIFTLLNSFQGVLIAYLYCFAKSDVTTKWKSTFMSSFSKSTDKSQMSTGSALHPNTKSSSLAMTTTVSLPRSRPNTGNGASNIYNNVATSRDDAVYAQCTEDVEHIYEDYDNARPLSGRSSAQRPTMPEKEDINLPAHLKGVVKEKVESFEIIARDQKDGSFIKTCPDNAAQKIMAPEDTALNNTSFRIKSDSCVSDDSNTAFNL